MRSPELPDRSTQYDQRGLRRLPRSDPRHRQSGQRKLAVLAHALRPQGEYRKRADRADCDPEAGELAGGSSKFQAPKKFQNPKLHFQAWLLRIGNWSLFGTL